MSWLIRVMAPVALLLVLGALPTVSIEGEP
jgi:hypothetical protein